jgi:hypothetical protein
MPLNFPKLSLPDVEETIAFRAIDSILRTDPVLQRVVKSWSSWNGESGDVFMPTPATCPSLELTPQPTASRWEAEGMHAMPFNILIRAAVNGTDVNQIMNMWGFVRRALWPSDPTRLLAIQTRIAEARVTRPTLTMQGYGTKLAEGGVRLLAAQGTLNVLLLIDTP